MDQKLNLRSKSRRLHVLPASILAIILCAHAVPAHARETNPDGKSGAVYGDQDSAESTDGEPSDDEAEDGKQEPPVTEKPEDEYRPRDGATARRELLFRDGNDERDRRFRQDLDPGSAMRNGRDAYDAQSRGRNAQDRTDVPPGWAVSGSINGAMQIDDNPLLESSEQSLGQNTSAWGYVIDPGFAVTRRTPFSLFQAAVGLPYNSLTFFDRDDRDNLNSFDQFAGLQYDLHGRETAFNAFANVSNTTTRIALVEDTGAGLSDNRALTYGGGGSIKHAVTPNSVIQVSVAARRQNLDQADLNNSTIYVVAGDFRTLATATDTVGVGASFQQFLPEGLDAQDTDIITAMATWNRMVRPSLTFDVQLGAQIISSRSLGDPLNPLDVGTKVSPYAEAVLYWAVDERDDFSFAVGHGADPSGVGELRSTTHVQLNFQRDISRQLTFGVPLLVVIQDSALGNDQATRKFFQVAPTLAWEWGPSWGLGFQYRFRLNDQTAFSTATSNAAFLTLGYSTRLFP